MPAAARAAKAVATIRGRSDTFRRAAHWIGVIP
jgi:hypothetical protein